MRWKGSEESASTFGVQMDPFWSIWCGMRYASHAHFDESVVTEACHTQGYLQPQWSAIAPDKEIDLFNAAAHFWQDPNRREVLSMTIDSDDGVYYNAHLLW
jgi:hypothetical protein